MITIRVQAEVPADLVHYVRSITSHHGIISELINSAFERAVADLKRAGITHWSPDTIGRAIHIVLGSTPPNPPGGSPGVDDPRATTPVCSENPNPPDKLPDAKSLPRKRSGGKTKTKQSKKPSLIKPILPVTQSGQ